MGKGREKSFLSTTWDRKWKVICICLEPTRASVTQDVVNPMGMCSGNPGHEPPPFRDFQMQPEIHAHLARLRDDHRQWNNWEMKRVWPYKARTFLMDSVSPLWSTQELYKLGPQHETSRKTRALQNNTEHCCTELQQWSTHQIRKKTTGCFLPEVISGWAEIPHESQGGGSHHVCSSVLSFSLSTWLMRKSHTGSLERNAVLLLNTQDSVFSPPKDN